MKSKFEITKHTLKNGQEYFTCAKVEETYTPFTYLNAFKFILGIERKKRVVRHYLTQSGDAYNNIFDSSIFNFSDRHKAIIAIDKYMLYFEKIDGEKVISSETEIIIRNYEQ